MSEEIADVIDEAANLIEQLGWIQHAGETPNGLCAVRALAKASGVEYNTDLSVEKTVLIHRARRAVENLVGCTWIPTWNDQPGRTKQEVLDVLRKAAKNERG